LKAIVQCKAWKAYRVGVKPVRELFGVMAARGVTDGYFFTTGEFTDEARRFAENTGLRLVTGLEFFDRIQSLTESEQRLIYTNIVDKDYTTPTCPSCDIKMVERIAKRGRNQGQTFWGCPAYPNCHQTFRN
jgi:restriction system protein